MTGLILRLAGPLQSWGEHSTFSERDTVAFPTRSGVIGLFAAAHGLGRGESLHAFEHLDLTVRIDRPGRRLVDFHTVGGGYPRARTVQTAEGKRRTEGTTTLVSNRHYLSDAVFTIGVASRDHEDLGWLAAVLQHPAWAPYLGRRSCVPDQPLLLADDVEDVGTELRERTPIPKNRYGDDSPRRADFIYETPPNGMGIEESAHEFMDTPLSFATLNREYRTRRVYRRTETVTARQYGLGEHDPLIEYARGAQR